MASKRVTHLCDTPEAIAWLKQFNQSPGDREIAETLLRSLLFVTVNEFQAEMRTLLQSLSSKLSDPLALYVARELGKKEMYFPNLKARPKAVLSTGEVGSEGFLASFATQMVRQHSDRFLFHPPLLTVKKKRLRHIVILDDISASGDQAAKMIRGMLRNKYFRSWWRYGLIQIHIVAYAIGNSAESIVRSEFSKRVERKIPLTKKIHFAYFRRSPVGSDIWSVETLGKIEAVCKKYCPKLGPRRRPLGHKQLMGILVFEHGCPNYVPGVVWQDGPGWKSLFSNRVIPGQVASTFQASNEIHQPDAKFQKFNRPKLARFFRSSSPSVRNILLLLLAAKRGIRKRDRQLKYLGLPTSALAAAQQTCQDLNLLDSNNYLTKEGINALKDSARLGKVPFEPPPLSLKPYFPQQLRGPS